MIINQGQFTEIIKCINCGFDIFITPNQSLVICNHCKTTNDLRISFLNDNKLIEECEPLTRVKKEILKKHIDDVGHEGFSKLLYDTNLKIMSRSLERFKEKVELTEEEIELLVLYNEFCSKFE